MKCANLSLKWLTWSTIHFYAQDVKILEIDDKIFKKSWWKVYYLYNTHMYIKQNSSRSKILSMLHILFSFATYFLFLWKSQDQILLSNQSKITLLGVILVFLALCSKGRYLWSKCVLDLFERIKYDYSRRKSIFSSP